MLPAYGLYSHIQANRVRSFVLLAGFVVLLHAIQLSVLILLNAAGGGSVGEILTRAARQMTTTWPLAMLVALTWFAIAWFFHQRMIQRATGAHAVTRRDEPALYDALETLCISRGITMPRLEVIETPALNAYAAGLKEGDYVIAVTRGLLEQLSPEEVEAVLAHELTHIRNRDTQMMVVAIIFAGIVGFLGDMLIRGWDFPYGLSPKGKRRDGRNDDTEDGWSSSGGSGSRGGRGGGGNGGGAIIVAVLIAVAIILISWGVSTLIRFALSRSREYLADAGAVELTKNPDAMISALRKISRAASFEVPSRMEAFFIENPLSSRITGLLATHPPIEERIAALVRFGGGRDLPTASSVPTIPRA
jgi:heat shock protein HtpX